MLTDDSEDTELQSYEGGIRRDGDAKAVLQRNGTIERNPDFGDILRSRGARSRYRRSLYDGYE